MFSQLDLHTHTPLEFAICWYVSDLVPDWFYFLEGLEGVWGMSGCLGGSGGFRNNFRINWVPVDLRVSITASNCAQMGV